MKISLNHQGTKSTKARFKILGVLGVFVVQLSLANAQSAEKLDALAKVNEARRSNGAPPLAWNPQLDKAAQRHSEDMASKGFVDEIGSDGSSSRQRVEASGYAKWPSVRMWAEGIFAGQTTFDEAINFMLSDEGQRRSLLNPKLREIGIGIARDNLRTYWTLTFGSQPNLLPIFINDDAPTTNDRQVTVQLTQEDAVPDGESNAIGRVVGVRISDKSDFAGVTWQPWQALLSFTVSGTTGTTTIYVQMRDGAGRTTIATDNIEYDPNSRDMTRPINPDAIATLTPAPTPTQELIPLEPTSLATASATATPIPPTATAAATPSPAQIAPTPTAVVIGNPAIVAVASEPTSPAATSLPIASATVAVVAAPSSTQSTSTATGASSGAIIVLVEPTPTPTSVNVEVPTASVILASPTPETSMRQFDAADTSLPNWLIPLYLLAQASVIVLGLIALIRRK